MTAGILWFQEETMSFNCKEMILSSSDEIGLASCALKSSPDAIPD
jgi:hypothetical protein